MTYKIKNKKYYAIIRTKTWYKEMNIITKPKKPYIVVIGNEKTEKFSPIKSFNTENEGKKYIKSKNGKLISLK